MPWGVAAAAVGAVGAIGSSVIGSNASQSAANTQANAANSATAAELQMYNQNEANLQPYMGAGNNALTALQSFLGLNNGTGVNGTGTAPGVANFQWNPANDPLYNFQLQTGENAILNNASSLGGVNSGATLEALTNYGQQTAQSAYQTEFNNWNTQLNNVFSRLSGISGQGANAAAGVAGIGTNVAGEIGSNTIGAGNAQAAGTIGSANAFSSGLQSIFSNSGLINSLQGLANNNNGAANASVYSQNGNTPQDLIANYSGN
jgi:hypothetical protein